MAKTVNTAFDEFMKDYVNLDADRTKKARNSRDWLVDQILGFPVKDSDFPAIYNERNIFFGSFARRTKKRPLDDIDMMIALKAQGCTYFEYSDRIEITVPDTSAQFKKLCNDNTSILNSKKLINLFVKNLKDVAQYENADIKRNQEAATLKLLSYEWNFDVVPCFFTSEDAFGRTYYMIPDGNGNWKKTDPRLDRNRTNNTNISKNGRVLGVIRAIKYWNKRATMPSMSSYLIENMILDYYESNDSETSQFVDVELVNIFGDIKSRVYNNVNDPKNIQGNINTLTWDEKTKISSRASSDCEKAKEARKLEDEGRQEESINKWKEIFGNEFPKYE
jgi:hypothetical protein